MYVWYIYIYLHIYIYTYIYTNHICTQQHCCTYSTNSLFMLHWNSSKTRLPYTTQLNTSTAYWGRNQTHTDTHTNTHTHTLQRWKNGLPLCMLLRCNNGIGGFNEKFPPPPPLLHPTWHVTSRADTRHLFCFEWYVYCNTHCNTLQHTASHCNKILQRHSTLIVSREVHVLQHALLCTAPHYITRNNILQQPSTSRPDTPFVAVRVAVYVPRDTQWVSSIVAVSYWVCCSVLQCIAIRYNAL